MNELIDEITERYMRQLFYFSLKKTSNEYEAEDLTQEIILEVIKSLNGGSIPADTKAWVWKIARNRYAKWAKRRIKARNVTDIDELWDIIDDGESLEENIIRNDETIILRRELALLHKEYRDIICEYYFANRSLVDIAASLGLPAGTVKRKIYECRKNIKEGMKMSRNYGKRSFAPENIIFTQNWNPKTGQSGDHYIKRLLPQNILLEAYDNPCTEKELSLALGIAMPYMEEEIRLLLEGELLVKDGDKYKTNIIILSKDAQDKIHDAGYSIVDRLTQLVINAVDEIGKNPELPKNQSFDDMKPTLIELFFENLPHDNSSIIHIHTIKHKDGSEWALMGMEKTDKVAQWLEVWGNEVYHQIIMLGNRTDDLSLDIDISALPVFSGELKKTLFKTSYNGEITELLSEFEKKKAAILENNIPKYLRNSAMFASTVDFRRLVIGRAIETGYIKLHDDMNTSTMGIWMITN